MNKSKQKFVEDNLRRTHGYETISKLPKFPSYLFQGIHKQNLLKEDFRPLMNKNN